MVSSLHKEKSILQLETRKQIYETIKKYAGIHTRELERKTKLSTGSVHHHLRYLKKHHLIREEKIQHHLRYFPASLSIKNTTILALLRQQNIRHILLYLLVKQQCTHKDMMKHLNVSPSTMSWYMKRLMKENILQATKKGREVHYKLNMDKEHIMKVLLLYKESFMDRLVNQTIEMWEWKQ